MTAESGSSTVLVVVIIASVKFEPASAEGIRYVQSLSILCGINVWGYFSRY